MKNVGGPARNEIRSSATRASACSGSKRRTSTERMPAAPGHQHAVEQARDVGHRRRHQHRVGRAEAVHPRHQRRLPAQAAVRVQHGLGDPGRAGGEQDQRDVGGLAGASCRPRTGGAAQRVGERGGVRDRVGPELDDERRVDLGRAPPPRRPRRRSAGRGAATAPMRQQARVRTAAARLLGTCQATASPRRDAALAQAAGDRGHQRLGLGAGRAGCHRRRPRRRAPRAARRVSARPTGRRVAGSARAWLGTQVGRRRAVTAGHHTRAPLT